MTSDSTRTGHVTVDGAEIYYEVTGNVAGKPALYLHGGPGSGLRSRSYMRHFDPAKYLVIGIDQRGCGRSRPHLSDSVDLNSLATNNTQALIADIEAVRQHLSIPSWIVTGVSWGCTLSLAYAQAHPEKVAGLVLVAVTATSREEVDWFCDGFRRMCPEAWERFAAESGKLPSERTIEAYARRLAGGGPADRLSAARAWITWEDAVLALDPGFSPRQLNDTDAVAFATLVTHYWSNDGFLRNGKEVLSNMARIEDIPGYLISGRKDVSSPVITAWRLHQKWRASHLSVIEAEGHGGPESMAKMKEVLDHLA